MRRIVPLIFLIVIHATNAFAWGEDGHRIVCRIAYDLLTPDEQKKVDELTTAYDTPADTRLQIHSFPDACVFADEARSKAEAAAKAGDTTSPWLHYKGFGNWHFINVERSVVEIPPDACHDDCVLVGIDRHSAMLKTGATDQDRGEGLFFLGHWIGDIHQPLHVSFADDRGGNTVEPVTGGFYPVPSKYPLNLHAVWDGAILRKAVAEPGWRAFADHLEAKITDAQKAEWLTETSLQWAQESYDITTSKDVLYCRRTDGECVAFGHGRILHASYQKKFLDDVELRLQKAGVRLASMIHQALMP
jgi:hypothetical protein